MNIGLNYLMIRNLQLKNLLFYLNSGKKGRERRRM